MNTMLADVQPLNLNMNESVSRSDLKSNGPKGDKFSTVLSREMSQDRKLSAQAEYPQATDNKGLKSNSRETSEVADSHDNGIEMPVAWLEYLADQDLSITSEAPVQPVEVILDHELLTAAIDSGEVEELLINPSIVAPGEALPANGKTLPPGGKQADASSVISISALATQGQLARGDLPKQSRAPQVSVEADEALLAKSTEPSVPGSGLPESVLALKSNANADAYPFKTNDFQMMQSAVAEVAELNNSQARMQNPSAIVSAGNNPQTSLLLPGELETLSVNNTRDTTAWGNGVGERVHWMINQKLNTATIRLDPPSLGRLEINIQVNDDTTKVTIQTQHAQTRDIIENASFKLREFLQENGYQNVSVDVSQQQGQQQQASQQTGDDSGETITDSLSAQDSDEQTGHGDSHQFSSNSIVDYFA